MPSALANNITGNFYLNGTQVTATAAQLNSAAAITYPVGTATNDSASAGNIGQLITSVVTIASATAITANTITDLTSISLTAGDWDVFGSFGVSGGAINTAIFGAISTTSVTFPDKAYASQVPVVLANLTTTSLTVPTIPMQLAGTTTVYLVVEYFGSTTGTMYGTLYARRRR